MNCESIDRDLDAFVDRELDPDADAAARAHLDACAACRARVSARQMLARSIRMAPYYPAPDRLRARLSARASRSASVRRLVTWAAAAVLILAAGAGAARLRLGARADDRAVDDAVNAHVRSLMVDHLFDVRSTDQHTVKPWFLGKLDFAPPVADLAAIGYPLVGGRVDYLNGHAVAALVYQRRQHVINVFVSPAEDGGASAGDGSQTVRGFHVRHWAAGGMAWWAVSDVNDAELRDFTRALGSE